ncbi:nicotianamine synthase-like protein [Cinnamomum micranthum f. kanehirae]|uniref:Nicotianamine synthase n=1 Tax=Cinnamomum micranthum f. kanehirae TaxID=337451 RepID=A0A443PHA1_9MAGN|nr:nicotianamine synthase-like protein [Cinnamomum micranthum f. kanehirae]
MASPQQTTGKTYMPAELLIAHIVKIQASISNLESLRPSKPVNSLFTQLVKLCTLPSSIDVQRLPADVQRMRESLIRQCGQAEGLLELEFSTHLTKLPHPMSHLNLFPYYTNYVKLASMEHQILFESGMMQPKRVAFVGSGPMPLTSIIMATHHMKSTHFINYDVDESANILARQLIAMDDDLEKRMEFKTCDIMDVKEELGSFDCIFLAALVGMSKEEKVGILDHIREYMKGGGILLVRSANGARAFLYPIIEEDDLHGFEVLSIFHPTNDVINSVVLVRKPVY